MHPISSGSSGIKAVLAPRFGDIFRSNAGKQGPLTGVICTEHARELQTTLAATPGTIVTVDLTDRVAAVGSVSYPFQIDDYTRWRLLEGLDDIGLTLRNDDAIAQFEARRAAWRPRTTPLPRASA